MTENDPKRFDLIAALQGRTYPEDKVTIFLDEDRMYAYAKASQDADNWPQDEEKQKIAADIFNTFADLAITVTVKGVPRHLILEAVKSVEEKYPTKTNAFGQIMPNQEANDEYNLRAWSLFIQKMETSDGSFNVPSPEEVDAFRKAAPGAALDAVGTAIDKLTTLTSSGYEQVVQDPDFLSRRSRTV